MTTAQWCTWSLDRNSKTLWKLASVGAPQVLFSITFLSGLLWTDTYVKTFKATWHIRNCNCHIFCWYQIIWFYTMCRPQLIIVVRCLMTPDINQKISSFSYLHLFLYSVISPLEMEMFCNLRNKTYWATHSVVKRWSLLFQLSLTMWAY